MGSCYGLHNDYTVVTALHLQSCEAEAGMIINFMEGTATI